MTPRFPFNALVGQPDLTLALLLNAIDPAIGGVLIRGERGSAKSTAARALAELLPPHVVAEGVRGAPFVELPLGATEDRIVGSFDLESALREGRPALRPGLLTLADGGVLYVDEVNLLADHLVDLLLDAAASGRVTIERDGLSASHPARFLLLGSMNPEEGELRPQFLDRFGLCVDVRAPTDPRLRAEAIRTRLDFDSDPEGFVARHASATLALRERLAVARARIADIPMEDSAIQTAAQLCTELALDGIRGDLTLLRAARALAAWEGAATITHAHLQGAARFALSHRKRRRSFERPPAPPTAAAGSPPPPKGNTPKPSANQPTPSARPPENSGPGNSSVEQPAPSAPAVESIRLTASMPEANAAGRHRDGQLPHGPVVRVQPTGPGQQPDGVPTLHAAALRGARVTKGAPLTVARSDWRSYQRHGHGTAHVLFVVDASGSMAAQRRLSLAKGAMAGLLAGSYQQRDRVALMIFRGEEAELVLPFTKDVDHAEAALQAVPTGGRTPLAHALRQAASLFPAEGAAVLVLFTDGRANVPDTPGGDPWQDAQDAATALRQHLSGAVVVDCEAGAVKLARAQEIADRLDAECLALDALDAGALTLHLQGRLRHA